MIRPYFRILNGQSFTVDQVVQEAYALIAPGTTTEDATRRAGARKALRSANPGLPAADNVVITGFTHLWLRRIARIPFRIPATTPATLRTELATLKIHDIWMLCQLSPRYVKALPGITATSTQVDRLFGICRLLKVRGMSVGAAVALHDNATTPITSPAALRDASQVVVKNILYAADPTMPASFKSLRPAWRLQRAARQHAPRPGRGHVPRFVGGFPETVVAREVAFWTDEFRSHTRSQSERVSAVAIALLFEIQRSIAMGNALWAKGDGASAYPHLRRVWSLVGAAAVRNGVVASSSLEASGPSLQTIMATCGILLSQIEPADADLSRQRLEVGPERIPEGTRGFTMSELSTGSRTTLRTALDSKELWVVNRIRRRRAMALLSDKKRSELGTTFTAGMETANASVRVTDLRAKDREVLAENIGGATVLQFRTQFPTEWTTLETEVELADVKDAAGTSLAGLANAHVTATFPSVLLANMTPFERFYTYRPSRRANASPVRVPLNGNFATRYRLDFLAPMAADPNADVWMFSRGDFADPARFCFVLPALMGRTLRTAMVRTQNPNNNFALVSAGHREIGRESKALATTAPIEPLANNASAGALQVNSVMDFEPGVLQTLVEDNVKAGDKAYRLGRVERARTWYQQAIDEVRGDNVFGYLAARVDTVHGELQRRIEIDARAGLAPTVSLPDLYIDTAASETSESLFPGLYAESTTQVDLSARGVARVPGAVSIGFYNNPGSIRTLQLGESYQDGANDTFDQDDDNERDNFDVDLKAIEADIDPGYNRPPRPELTGTPMDEFPWAAEADAIEPLLLHAATEIAKIDAGLNWLGLDPDGAPAWKFEYLLSQSRYFAEKTDALQQRALSLLQAAESRTVTETQAASAAELATAGVEVAVAQTALASAQVELAIEQLKAAELAEKHTKDDKWWATATGIASTVASAVGADSEGAAIIAAVSGAISTSAGIVSAVEAEQEAKAQTAVANAQVFVATSQLAVANAEQSVAALQETTARAFLEMLQDQELTSASYQELMTFVASIASSYLLMANRLAFLTEKSYELESRRRTSYVKQNYGAEDTLEGRFQSGALLLAALDGLAHERVTSTLNRYQPIKTTFSLITHLPSALWQFQNTGATYIRITQKDLDLRFPGLYLHALKRVEVEFVGLLPPEGVHAVLRVANNCFVRVPNDSAYVGNPKNVVRDWAYPAANWRIGNTTESTTKPQAPFVMKPVLGFGLTQVLSEYRRDRDTVVLAPPEGALDVFENLATDLAFTLEMPPTGNRFEFIQIADVRITLYFTAQSSEVLRAQQRQQLIDQGRSSFSRTLVASTDAADSLAVFTSRAPNPARYDARYLTFELGTDRLAPHTKERIIQNVQLALLGLKGASLKVRLAGTPFALPSGANTSKAVVSTTQVSASLPSAGLAAHIPDGMVFTAIGETEVRVEPGNVLVYASRAGTYPTLETAVSAVNSGSTNFENVVGRYVVKVVPDGNPVFHQRDDTGAIVSVAATELSMSAGAVLASVGGPWWYGDTRVLVKLSPPTADGTVVFAVFQRHGTVAASPNQVGAEIRVTRTGGALQMRVRLVEGTTTTGIAPQTVDADYPTDFFDTPFELGLRVFGQTAELYLDRVRVLSRTVAVVPVAGGKVALLSTGNPTPNRVLQVTHQQLRYDEAPLDTVLDEPFTTLSNWVVTGTASLVPTTRQTLDLSFLEDALFQVDYTARWDL